MESRPQSNSELCQSLCCRLTIHSWQHRNRPALMFSRKYPDPQSGQFFGAAHSLMPLSGENIPDPHSFQIPQSRSQTHDTGDIQCSRLPPVRKFLRHFLHF